MVFLKFVIMEHDLLFFAAFAALREIISRKDAKNAKKTETS